MSYKDYLSNNTECSTDDTSEDQNKTNQNKNKGWSFWDWVLLIIIILLVLLIIVLLFMLSSKKKVPNPVIYTYPVNNSQQPYQPDVTVTLPKIPPRELYNGDTRLLDEPMRADVEIPSSPTSDQIPSDQIPSDQILADIDSQLDIDFSSDLEILLQQSVNKYIPSLIETDIKPESVKVSSARNIKRPLIKI